MLSEGMSEKFLNMLTLCTKVDRGWALIFRTDPPKFLFFRYLCDMSVLTLGQCIVIGLPSLGFGEFDAQFF
uniref:Uncharacterized protein n=1 Tax=Candidatus Kentrum sp. SD TaxID=2126332 RepID=A0A451BLU0_9GAMM|nr:MAG: hypothetical protein BECKSD772D_GA0070982_10432 [Candidatus Kentron sp. SD]